LSETRSILVVTSFNQDGLEKYAHRCLETFRNWPVNARLVVYAEDCKPEVSEMVEVRDLHKCCPDLVEFKERYKNLAPPDWRWNVVKFSNKVFAAVHALKDHEDVGVWLDADCVTYCPIPNGLIESLFDEGRYLAFYKRPNFYTETGFWAVDGSSQWHKPFLSAFKACYTDGTIFEQSEWHDCMAFDYARKRLEAKGMPCHNLTPKEYPQLHPMSVSLLSPFIDHCKGNRKTLGYSPEYRRHTNAMEVIEKKAQERAKRAWTRN